MAQITLNSSGVASSGSLLLQTNGTTTQATLDTSGNLGLGVTPSAWSGAKAIELGAVGISVFNATGSNNTSLGANVYYAQPNYKYAATGAATLYQQLGGVHYWFNAGSGTAGTNISLTQAMTLDANGQLGIGATSMTNVSNYKFVVTNAATGGGLVCQQAGTDKFAVYNAGNDGYYDVTSNHIFRTGGAISGTERARIDSSGNLLVGKTTTSGTTVGFAYINGSSVQYAQSASTNANSTWETYSTGAGAYRFYVGMGGTIYATSTTITAISDQRLKENIQDLDVGLDAVMALKPRKFDWKEGKGKNKKGDRGWIAQEFEQVFPDMIDEWRDPAPEGEEPYKAVNADLIPVLVKAIQELNAKFEAYKAAHP